jgi:sulfur-oxidizing protein SoxZ
MPANISSNPIPMRLTIKGEARLGQMVQAILAIGHPMESGYRVLESGGRVPKNVIEKITVRLGDQLLFMADTGIGISAHPYMAFPVILPKIIPNGGLRLVASWMDDQGQHGELTHDLGLELR